MKTKLLAAAFMYFLLPQAHADTLKCQTEWNLPTYFQVKPTFLGMGTLAIEADCLDKRQSNCLEASVLNEVLDFSKAGRVSITGTLRSNFRYDGLQMDVTSLEWQVQEDSLDLYFLFTDFSRRGWKEVHRTRLSNCVFLD